MTLPYVGRALTASSCSSYRNLSQFGVMVSDTGRGTCGRSAPAR